MLVSGEDPPKFSQHSQDVFELKIIKFFGTSMTEKFSAPSGDQTQCLLDSRLSALTARPLRQLFSH